MVKPKKWHVLKNCPSKIPKYITTHLNTVCDAFEYVIQRKALIALLTSYQTAFKKKKYEKNIIFTLFFDGLSCNAEITHYLSQRNIMLLNHI